jgi:DHA1 family multidrug resistance protein-like MFS transporter
LSGLISIIVPPIFGKLSDNFGRKKIIFLGALISSISFIIYLYVNSYYLIIITRILQISSALIIGTTVAAYIGDILPPKKTGMGMGVYQTTLSFDRTVGTMIGGFISDLAGIQTVFILALISSFLSLVLANFYLED